MILGVKFNVDEKVRFTKKLTQSRFNNFNYDNFIIFQWTERSVSAIKELRTTDQIISEINLFSSFWFEQIIFTERTGSGSLTET